MTKMQHFFDVKNVYSYTFASPRGDGKCNNTYIYMHIIGIPPFHRDQKTRARVRELRDLQVRASGLLGQKMKKINNMYIYALLQKKRISVFNIRERDFHVFEELQKRNNTHIYTYY